MKNFALALAGALLAAACSREPATKLHQGPEMVGLAGPLVLTKDNPDFYPSDYIVDTLTLDRLEFEHMEVARNKAFQLYPESSEDQYGWVELHAMNGDSYEVPVFFAPIEPINFEYRGAADSVFIFGTFNAWNRGADKMADQGNLFRTTLELAPDTYQFKYYVWKDGAATEAVDVSMDSISNGMGGFNSNLVVPHSGEGPAMLKPELVDDRTIELEGLADDQFVLAYWQNKRLELDSLSSGHYRINIPEIDESSSYAEGRSHLRVFSVRNFQRSNDLLIPLDAGNIITNVDALDRSDWQTVRMYFMMVDRFKNGKTENDSAVDDPDIQPIANYYGGDIPGITQVVESGFFDELHMNTVWISPIVQNPWDAWGLWDKGGITSKFSGYHGYWPISNVRPDVRFGTPEEVRSLLDASHNRGFNVLTDYVANHVHQLHPIFIDHPDWATPLYLPDGTLNTERWDDQRLTTWFDTFMPTLELRNPEVVNVMTDSAMVWVADYDFDGFRHDATKHIDELYWRKLTRKIKEAKLDRRIYQIGETYGSPELINSYVSNGMLDAQFDFNVYDAAVSAFVNEDASSVENLVTTLKQSWNTYGYHNLMGYISGNQDRSRFITLASGDVRMDEDQKLAGWTRDIPKPQPTAYRQLATLHALNFAIPGIPVIYYGDEYGMWGANDPDNRKMMKFTGYDADEAALRADVEALAAARAREMALLYGETEIEITHENVIHITRSYLGDQIQIWINPGSAPVPCAASTEHILAGHLVEGEGGNLLEAHSFVYVKE